jgi:formiminotetrahydrofolate cyclodeaminase
MTPERSLSGRTLDDVLDAFASNAPVPGGGSAAALAGAIGVALLIMVATLKRTRAGDKESHSLADAAERLQPLRTELTALVDRDADAYASVVSALRLPKADDTQKAARRHALHSAMRSATEAPLETMRLCRRALGEALAVAERCVPSAASDVGVAIELLRAAVHGADMNVDTNLASMDDAAYVSGVSDEKQQLAKESRADADRGLTLVAAAKTRR